MGEHDLRTDDGMHQDIKVSHAKRHYRYDPGFKLNDIGIVHLERDVEFSGGNEFIFELRSIRFLIIVFILLLNRPHTSDMFTI